MKKMFFKSALLAVASIGLMASSAIALPFMTNGTIDQNAGSGFDASTLSGTAVVDIYINDSLNAGISISSGYIVFEGDIFSSITNFSVSAPTDWSTGSFGDLTAATSLQYDFGQAGTNVSMSNDPLTFTFDYTLQDLDMFSQGSGSGWAWDEGGSWELQYQIAGLDKFGNASAAGSSTSPVPEPATMLLFGTGLAGLAGFSRKKSKKA